MKRLIAMVVTIGALMPGTDVGITAHEGLAHELPPTAPATVHLSVTKSSPAANQVLEASPKQLQIWFSQVPAAGISQLTLEGPDKKAVAVGKTVIDKDAKSLSVDVPTALAGDAYVITWRTAGDDGHPQNGTIAFSIKPKN